MPKIPLKWKKVLWNRLLSLRQHRHAPKRGETFQSADQSSKPVPSTSTGTGTDYFVNVESDFQSELCETEVRNTLQIREQLISEMKNVIAEPRAKPKEKEPFAESKRKKGNNDLHASQMSVLHDNTLRSLFARYSIPCEKCMGKLDLKFHHKSGNTSLQVKCMKCDFVDDFPSRCLDKGSDFSQVNMQLVYESFEDGRGYTGYHKVCASLAMEPLSKARYYKVKNHIGSLIFDSFKSKSCFIHQCLLSHYATLGRYPDINGVLDIDVSFDGSWLTRGHHHRSHIGIGVIIDSFTGMEIDFHVVSNYCAQCTRLEIKKMDGKISNEKYDNMSRKHENTCNKNFEGKSGAMEGECAKVLWGRSLQNIKLRYVNFISDGDSSAFETVTKMNDGKGPYDKKVEKHDCVNHVSKRFGTKLRKLRDEYYKMTVDINGKPNKKKLLSGRHKLTESVIEHLARYYGIAVRRCVGGTIHDLKDNIMAILYHCGSTYESHNHQLCPKGASSYCFYNSALPQKEKTKSHKEMLVYFRLEGDERKVVLNAFREMSKDELLQRCLMGKTQNPNESLHSKIWYRLSKTKFFGLQTIQQSVCLTVLQHNFGYKEACPLPSFGFGEVAPATARHLDINDAQRKRLKHSRTHSGEKPLSSDECDQSFSKKQHLVDHSRIHTGEKPFSCDVCDRSFSHKHHLADHSRIHTGEKPFSCEVCDMSFRKKCTLIRHTRTHSSEKPFSCNVCGKSFSYRKSLVYHSRIHPGEKPFSCDVCDKSFSFRSTLIRHSKQHTEKKGQADSHFVLAEVPETESIDIKEEELMENDTMDEKTLMDYSIKEEKEIDYIIKEEEVLMDYNIEEENKMIGLQH